MTQNLLTPKDDFLSDPAKADAHQERVLSPEFKRAMQIALLHYTMGLGGDGADAQRLVTVGLKIEGAKGFIKELLNLGDKVKYLQPKPDDELDKP